MIYIYYNVNITREIICGQIAEYSQLLHIYICAYGEGFATLKSEEAKKNLADFHVRTVRLKPIAYYIHNQLREAKKSKQDTFVTDSSIIFHQKQHLLIKWL